MTSNSYVPDMFELIDCYAAHMEEHAGEDFRTSQADAERGIAKIKADARRSLIRELLADAELEAGIGRQGNDDERVKTAEKVIEMLNNTQVEEEA